MNAEQRAHETHQKQRDEEAAQQQDEPFVELALGTEARIDALEKEEGWKVTHLAPQAEKEMEDDRQRDGRKQPGRGGMSEKRHGP